MHSRSLTLLALASFLALVGSPAFAQDVASPPAPPKAAAGTKRGPRAAANQQLAAEYNAAQSGVAMLVMIGGEIVFEDYPTRFTATSAHQLASGTKSFVGAMAVAAQMDGLLTLDETIATTITEWADDDPRSKITIRQLLSLASGLDAGDNFQPPAYADSVHAERVAAPGSRFAYGPAPFQLFGEIMRRKLEARDPEKTGDPVRYLTERVLTPIGLKVSAWSRGRDGHPFLPHGARLTARDWAKFGELIRLRGKCGDTQVLDAKMLEDCFRRSPASRLYGMTWWLPQRKRGTRAEIPHDLVLAAGLGGQKLWVSRAHDTVIVRQAPLFNRVRFDDDEFLARLFHGTDRRGQALTPSLKAEPTRAPSVSAAAQRFFTKHDVNGDDILTADELPAALVPRFDAADADADGMLSLAEVAAAFPAGEAR